MEAPAKTVLKVMVAVHGIGEQLRAETVRSVATRLCADIEPALPILPLGYFNLADPNEAQRAVNLFKPGGLAGDVREHLYFAEVYWADMAHRIALANDTLEQAPSWGKTIVSRAYAQYNCAPVETRKEAQLDDGDFRMAAGVVDEIVEAIEVLNNLSFLLAKMGIFKFDLAPLLRDYVGDVQLVADFPAVRRDIIARFHATMQNVHADMQARASALVAAGAEPDSIGTEIYIVAHSEGTVVSFLGLLEAFAGERDAEDWLDHVRGYMTFGSPIDKHLVLWPEIWRGLQNLQQRKGLPPIQWRNYTDRGDPVGFELDTARAWMADRGITVFDFQKQHDILFTRYLFPGKAHVDYWKDPGVFGHFVDEVVLRIPPDPANPKAGPRPKPGNKAWPAMVSSWLPFLVSLLIHCAGTYLLYKAVAVLLDTESRTGPYTIFNVLALGTLLFGITACARIPRLTKWSKPRNLARAFGLYALCCVPLLAAAKYGEAPMLRMVGALGALPGDASSMTGAWRVIVVGLAPAMSWVLAALSSPRLGRRWLLGIGGLVIAGLVGLVAWHELSGPKPPAVWPVVLAAAACFYAWWVGILTFDLSFIWRRYVRDNDDIVQKVATWHQAN
jgi:hypothetical protein